MDYLQTFERGLDYDAFLQRYANAEQLRRWSQVHAQVQLTEAQQQLLASFGRRMPVMVLAGAWCGDCVDQCPIFDHFARACPALDIRYFDRDDNPELATELSVCGGKRVPAVLFLSEDGYPCGRYGDRTLARYRQVVQSLGGAACPTGLFTQPAQLFAQVVQEWLDQFERAQWILRTSGRLRQLNGD